MANPRKFSEKIALLNQKEAEGNAEFERIMREVSEVSSKVRVESLDLSAQKSCSDQKRRKKKYSHLRSENLRCSEIEKEKKSQIDICVLQVRRPFHIAAAYQEDSRDKK